MTLHFCAVFVTVSYYGHPFPNTYFELILMAFLTKVSRFQRTILLFSFSLFFCILLISYKHCLRDFSITTWPIYIKLLDLNNNDLKLFAIFFNDDVTSGFETLTIFNTLQKVVSSRGKLLTIQDIEFKIIGIVDESVDLISGTFNLR